MYSGLLPEGLTEEELSPDEEEEEEPRKLISKEQSKAASAASASVSSSVDSVSACDASSDAQSSLPGISQEMWQKFKVLQKKKEEAKIIEVPRRRRKRRKKKGTVSKRDQPEDDSRAEQKKKERERHWDELKQYFGSNDRFQPPSCFKPPPKSGLEKSIERAIAEGDVAKAEEMSDSLATRELAVQIAQAADCRDYAKRKQEEDDLRASQKRKREIAWGFEAKQRWETKSNMGFM